MCVCTQYTHTFIMTRDQAHTSFWCAPAHNFVGVQVTAHAPTPPKNQFKVEIVFLLVKGQ